MEAVNTNAEFKVLQMQKLRHKNRRIVTVILRTIQKVSSFFFVWDADILIICQSTKLNMKRICSLLVFTVSRDRNYTRNNVHCSLKMTGTSFAFILGLVCVLEGQTVNIVHCIDRHHDGKLLLICIFMTVMHFSCPMLQAE